MKQRKGHVFQRPKTGKWYARVDYTDASGKRRELTRTANDEAHANELLAQLVAQAEQLAKQAQPDSTPQAITSPQASLNGSTHAADTPLLFSSILSEYEAIKVVPAAYRDDRKISGLRSERTVRIRLAVLRDYFGQMPVASITPSVIERFRLARLNTPTQYKRERAIASVNRELELLRSVMLWAVGEDYIQKAPRAPITKAHETRRTRILSPAEERKLLKACDTPDRKHIIPLIIFALSTGARANEIKQVRWSDVDIKTRTITLRATTTKTLRSRTLPISDRLMDVLIKLPDSPREARIFQMTTWQKSWNAACKDAGIIGLRFHDLRATFITRLVDAGVPAETVAKISGHQDVATLYKHYLRSSDSAIDSVRKALDSMKR